MLGLKNRNNALTLGLESEQEKRKLSSSSSTAKRSRLLFQEIFETEFSGSVYHPKFFDFDLNLGITPQQQKEESESTVGVSKFRNSYLSYYSFYSQILKEKPYGANLFFDQHRETLNRDFFERQVVDSDSSGITTRYRNQHGSLNTSFQNSHREITRTFRADQEYEDETFNFRLKPEKDAWGETRLDYSRNNFVRLEEGVSDQEGESDEWNVFNRYTWDEELEKSLNSRLYYRSLTGTRDSKDLTWTESLSIPHSETLETFLNYSFSDRSVSDVESQDQNLVLGWEHQLYESLTSRLSLRGAKKEATSFDENEVGLSLNENYKKNIGPAVLRLGWGSNYSQQRREAASASIRIVNESHTLSDGTLVVLNEGNVDITSIVVTNSNGTTIYSQDVDYQVIELAGGLVEIRRVVGGSIINGQAVMVDYTLTLDPSLKFTSLANDYRTSLDFFNNHLQFYYRLKTQRYPQVTGGRQTILEKFDDALWGSEVQWRQASFRAEYENYQSDLTPYEALRFSQSIGWETSPRGKLTLLSNQNYIHLSEENRNNYEIRGEYLLRLSPSAVLGLENGYRLYDGDRTDLKNMSSKVLYRINMGLVSFEAEYEFQQEWFFRDYKRNHFFSTMLKRRF
ncbi:MAG: hypothetical protein NUV91_04130 [Candidatus Omnitrophica bacterium]|nr:hypothetical protein [Candidatus Omnitrophota bacterium]